MYYYEELREYISDEGFGKPNILDYTIAKNVQLHNGASKVGDLITMPNGDVYHTKWDYTIIGGKQLLKNAEIKGKIEADSGMLGNISINEDGIGRTVEFEPDIPMGAEKSIRITEEGYTCRRNKDYRHNRHAL